MTAPNAYNRWQGNQFVIPGLPVRPTYAPALPGTGEQDPVADTLSQLGFRLDDPGRGPGEGEGGIGAGQQPTREADSFGDLATSAAKGLSMMSGPFGLATGLYGASQMPADKQAKPGWGWGDFAKSVVPGGGLFDMFGGGDQTFSGAGGANRAAGPTFGGVAPADEQAFMDMFGGGAGTNGGVPDISIENDTSDAMYNKGGTVKKLRGPNPPGPDDGYGGLQRGEEVVSVENVKKLKRAHGADLFDMVHKGRLPVRK